MPSRQAVNGLTQLRSSSRHATGSLLTLLLLLPLGIVTAIEDTHCAAGNLPSYVPDQTVCNGPTLTLVHSASNTRCDISTVSFTACKQYAAAIQVYWAIPEDTDFCDCYNTRRSGDLKVWNGDAFKGSCVICIRRTGAQAWVTADPVIHGFDGTLFYLTGDLGVPYALLSNSVHQVNGVLGSYSPGKHHDEWLVSVSLRYKSSVLEIHLDGSMDNVTVVQHPGDDGPILHMVHVDGRLPVTATLNGIPLTALLRTNTTMRAEHGELLLYFPDAPHEHDDDPLEGPLVVVQTPVMEWTLYYESEASLHLDLAMKLLSDDVDPSAMHGLLGQTLQWADNDDDPSAPHTHHMAGSWEDYRVTDGLSGTSFAYTQFHGAHSGDSCILTRPSVLNVISPPMVIMSNLVLSP